MPGEPRRRRSRSWISDIPKVTLFIKMGIYWPPFIWDSMIAVFRASRHTHPHSINDWRCSRYTCTLHLIISIYYDPEHEFVNAQQRYRQCAHPIRVPNNNNNGRNGAEEDSGIIIVLFTLIAFARVPRWYRMLSVISQWLLVLHRNIDTCLGHCYSSHGLSHPIMILFRFTRVNKLALNFIDNSLYRLIALNIPLGWDCSRWVIQLYWVLKSTCIPGSAIVLPHTE